MKNIILLIILFVLSPTLQSENWDLFPYNQKTYYYFQTGDVETITAYYMDYEEEKEGEVLQYPLRTYIESIGVCYPFPSGGIPKLNDTYFKSSSIDGLFGYIHKPYYYPFEIPENIEELQDTIPFYPYTSIGDSWEIRANAFNEEGFPFSHLVITCASKTFDEVIEGVEDSIKTFRIQAFEGENMVISDFDEVVVKLSKQYGLIEWSPFVDWIAYDLKTHIMIAGFEDPEGNIMGERTPLVTDFFPYEVGDSFVQEQRQIETNYTSINRYENSITEVDRTDTSIVYTYTRQISKIKIQTNNNDTLEISYTPIHTKTATDYYFPQHIIDLAYWELGIGEIREEFEGEISADFDIHHLTRLEDDNCGVAYQLSIEDIPCWFGTYIVEGVKTCESFCLPSDCDLCQKKVYHSKLGLIVSHAANSSLNHLNLIEATVGECYFTNIESPTYFAKQITLHPNPTQNRFRLQLQNPKIKNLQLTITDIHGRILQQIPLLQSSIEVDLSEQTTGIYLVQISDGQNWWTEKVVKF